jgi:hypothetical protein
MTTARINWTTALAPGARIVPVILVAGVPVVLTPAGVRATTVSVTSGTVSTTGTPATRITGTMRAPGESAVDQSMRAVVMRQALVSVGVADGATRPRSHSQ